MTRVAIFLVLPVALSLAADAPPSAERPAKPPPRVEGLRVPQGYEVTEYADSKLANDIYRLTVDPKGRIVVAGRGYIRILVDDDKDGRADRAIQFADGPKDGAMGILWEGDTVYVTGDGGLRRYRDANGDDKADGPSELIRAIKTGGEHTAHDIRRGPDGWLYVLCGDGAGIDKSFAQLPTSPIKNPIGGCVIRFTPDLTKTEIVADGFRNPYGMDFDARGELFTYDSDNERCVSLPWYEHTRFYHVVAGRSHGWLAHQHAQTWRLPPYSIDITPPLATLGRGSPTGIAFNRWGSLEGSTFDFFACDWTFGRIHQVRMQSPVSRAFPSTFAEARGEFGFAPTDIVVHPKTGDLYLSVGGRGTRGAVYRIQVSEANKLRFIIPAPLRTLTWWSHDKELVKALASPQNLFGPRELAALVTIQRNRSRFAFEELRPALANSSESEDSLFRQLAADLIATCTAAERDQLLLQWKSPRRLITLALAEARIDQKRALSQVQDLLRRNDLSPEQRRDCLRILVIALGDAVSPKQRGTVFEGYSLRKEPPPDFARKGFVELVLQEPAKPERTLNLERARVLAMLEDDRPASLELVLKLLADTPDPVDATHYLICAARLKSQRSEAQTKALADSLVTLDRRLREKKLHRDSNWPLRIGELHAELARKDARHNAAVLGHAEFGRADHVIFARSPGFEREKAARIFFDRARREADCPWTPGVVQLVGELPDGVAVPVLRKLWDNAGLREALLPILARAPAEEDRDKFLEGLDAPQLGTIRLCLDALEKLPPAKSGDEALALLRALRRMPEGREGEELRQKLAAALRRASGRDFGVDRAKWSAWFAKEHPKLAARLDNADGVDLAAWSQRFAKLDWSAGQASRGLLVYDKAGCATCHSGAQALGPDLRGVTGRFSRDDLFTAILQPSRDVSPRYQTTLLATADGKLHQGSIIYEAVDGLILQTGPATTIRLAGDQIRNRRVLPQSLMPAGLIDKLTDGEIVDLWAYLQALR
jgi:putative heme-binding domain-containing protein